jgi:hypothetical protein
MFLVDQQKNVDFQRGMIITSWYSRCCMALTLRRPREAPQTVGGSKGERTTSKCTAVQ